MEYVKRRTSKTEFKGNFSASLGAVEQIMSLNDITGENDERFATGIDEFDRVLGGGIVKGSLVLLSGDPGIGKSTILLQICQNLANIGQKYYMSAERNLQIKLN